MDKIRVLIIDDEGLQLDMLKVCIDWDSNGFEIVGDASDGREGLKKVKDLSPDVAIIDIDLPFINGLELSQIIKSDYPWTKVIILTGHPQFEYAKKAIDASVVSYLIKPIDSNELVQALMKIRMGIAEEQNKMEYITSLKAEARQAYNSNREKFLKSILAQGSHYSEEYIFYGLKSYDINIYEDNIIIAAVEIDNLARRISAGSDTNLWLFTVYNITNEVFSQEYNCNTLISDEKRIICIVNRRDKADCDTHTLFSDLCAKVRDSVEKYFDFTVSIGIGSCFNGLSNIGMAYSTAIEALKRKFYKGLNSIIYYSYEGKYKNMVLTLEDPEDLTICLRTGNSSRLFEHIDRLFAKAEAEKVDKNNIQLVSVEVISIALKYMDEFGMDSGELIDDTSNVSEYICSFESVNELKDWIVKVFHKIVNYHNSTARKNRDLSKGLVKAAQNYIELNYIDCELSLKKVSDNLFVNSSYLSNVFKKNTGVSVIEYITKIRMKKAKKLLETADELHLEEISLKVGYNDPYYFSKCFKKEFGVSPTRYVK